ncbi:MAG: hypothetical protein R3293_23135 [Candidatus Promineifilaceae bacterium]|nr:hypothetical protein [Candidatus Promineifilaceae bacterium]
MVISSMDQVHSEWLTAVLRKSGALMTGSVASFELGTGQGNWSESANLRLTYAAAARGARPERLFLKMVDTGASSADEHFGGSEVDYYLRDYVDVPDAPLLRCYDGAFSAELERYHLLLDDVSETHVEAAQKEPTLAYGLALADGLAILHARWWGAAGLAEAGTSMHDAAHIQRFVDIAAPGVEHILGQFAAELKPHWPDLLREVFANNPAAIMARTGDANGFSLIHGDVGQHNVLVPRHGARPLYIIDRQPFNWSLTTWLGAYDLAYAMVLDWDVEERRALEIPVLQRYHARLVDSAMADYSWERLFADYRLCVPMCVYIATEYCRGGINRRVDVWLPMLQRALQACDDWL